MSEKELQKVFESVPTIHSVIISTLVRSGLRS